MTTEELKAFRQDTLDDVISANFASVKARAGYAEVDAFDGEITELMSSAVMDMLTAGVPADMFEDDPIDARIINAMAMYVLAYIEQDRSDTNRYLTLYKRLTFKLSLEDGGAWDVESDD